MRDAHDALAALRPLPEAAPSVWVTYYLRSSAVYREVAERDRGHHGHAVYWAEREKAKADALIAEPATSDATPRKLRRKSSAAGSGEPATMPTRLEAAHEALREVQPAAQAGREVWQAYHRRAAAVYAEMAEVDRAHHHEALFYAALERRQTAKLSCQIDGPVAEPVGGNPEQSTPDKTREGVG